MTNTRQIHLYFNSFTFSYRCTPSPNTHIYFVLVDTKFQVMCENTLCPYGRWFHAECIDVNPDEIPDHFYCCETCQASPFQTQCLCNMKSSEQLILCTSGSQCLGAKEYHPSCVGFVPELYSSGKLA